MTLARKAQQELALVRKYRREENQRMELFPPQTLGDELAWQTRVHLRRKRELQAFRMLAEKAPTGIKASCEAG